MPRQSFNRRVQIPSVLDIRHKFVSLADRVCRFCEEILQGESNLAPELVLPRSASFGVQVASVSVKHVVSIARA
jgi:hypothetical protein